MIKPSSAGINCRHTVDDPATPAPGSDISLPTLQKESHEERINVISGSPQTGILSNFACTPFVLEGTHFNSVEAFIQAIKYTEADPRREGISELVGAEARRAGRSANKQNFDSLNASEPVFVYWREERIPYRSDRHFGLIESALRAKFEQNIGAADQLIATGNAALYHDTGRPEHMHTSLPGRVFCGLLLKIREELNAQNGR